MLPWGLHALTARSFKKFLGLELSTYRTNQRINSKAPLVRYSKTPSTPLVRRNLITGDVNPIYNEASMAFHRIR